MDSSVATLPQNDKLKWIVILSEAKNPQSQKQDVMRTYYVYIMTNKKNGTLYTGVTNNLEYRVYEHKHKLVPGFTSRYGLDRLVFYEDTDDISAAIGREKQIKGWLRKKKIALIESMNPEWRDLSE